MQSSKKTENRRLAVFKKDYQLRMGLTISTGEEFTIGRGYGEFSLDDEGNLILFIGEFTPHRVARGNFDLVDEVVVTTVTAYRRLVEPSTSF